MLIVEHDIPTTNDRYWAILAAEVMYYSMCTSLFPIGLNDYLPTGTVNVVSLSVTEQTIKLKWVEGYMSQ